MLTTLQDKNTKINRHSFKAILSDGASTTVHVVKYPKSSFRPRLVNLKKPTKLLDWCENNETAEAMGGGFFCRRNSKVLGDLWVDGEKHDSVPFQSPWHNVRASLHINSSGLVEIGHRHTFKDSLHHLLQAGPLLLKDGATHANNNDQEGFSSGFHQFDSDITQGRYPRAAIGTCKDFIWSVVCDGRSVEDAGATLLELSQIMKKLGILDALNLDGGGSASQISQGQLRNTPRDPEGDIEGGRPIYSAIVFDQK